MFDKNYKVILRTQIRRMRNDVIQKSDLVNVKTPEIWERQEETQKMIRLYDKKSQNIREAKQKQIQDQIRRERIQKFTTILETAKEARILHEKERDRNKWFC